MSSSTSTDAAGDQSAQQQQQQPQQQQFVCVKRPDASLTVVFEHMYLNERLVDVTLSCSNGQLQAHKLVLAACSPYFSCLFDKLANPFHYPVVVIKDMLIEDLRLLVEFMYRGQLTVNHEKLADLVKCAEYLQITGLYSLDTLITSPVDKNDSNHVTTINVEGPKMPPPLSSSHRAMLKRAKRSTSSSVNHQVILSRTYQRSIEQNDDYDNRTSPEKLLEQSMLTTNDVLDGSSQFTNSAYTIATTNNHPTSTKNLIASNSHHLHQSAHHHNQLHTNPVSSLQHIQHHLGIDGQHNSNNQQHSNHNLSNQLQVLSHSLAANRAPSNGQLNTHLSATHHTSSSSSNSSSLAPDSIKLKLGSIQLCLVFAIYTLSSGDNKRKRRRMDPRGPSDPAKMGRPTLKSGAPIGNKLNSLLLGPKGPNLLADVAYLEETAHFNRERIPERVVHAKGAAAFGHFTVTNTEICKYSKAAMFAQQGKQTPVVARFSHVIGESGISDTTRDVRGFAVKFYTEQGNWDLVGNNLPVFFVRDPINFSSFIHSQKRNPRTHLRDPDSFWDFVSLLPETLHTILMLFSERGIPDGFRHMHGFGVNTFKLVNAKNEAFYAKFHWICNQGIRNLDQATANKVAGLDPDYSLRDLYVNLTRRNPPSWTLKFQVMGPSDAEKVNFNAFDVTKTWPHADFPLTEIGTMVLDQNPDNYFAQVEQLAFSPGNMVPGIETSPDKMLIGRMMSYPDAQRYRMNANYADIPVNQPRCPVMTPTYCDSVTFNSNLHGSMPNYLPSNRYGNLAKLTDNKYSEHGQQFSASTGRFDLSQDDNFTQPRIFYTKVLQEESRRALASNIANHLALVTNKDIVAKVMKHFNEIEPKLVKDIETFMMMKAAKQ